VWRTNWTVPNRAASGQRLEPPRGEGEMSDIAQDLMTLSTILHWLGKYREANAVNRLALWLSLNGIHTQEELVELLHQSNDNPNIVPLTTPERAE
jgi:hypothetical protein